MSSPRRIPNGTATTVDFAGTAQVTASDAKNGFGRVLDRVAKVGRLAITKHDEPCAVLLSMDEYRALVAAKSAMLDTLSAEFDALYERMQRPGAAAAMQKAFAMTPARMGDAAVLAATRAMTPRAGAAPSSGATPPRAHVALIGSRDASAGAKRARSVTPARAASSPAPKHRTSTAGKSARRGRG